MTKKDIIAIIACNLLWDAKGITPKEAVVKAEELYKEVMKEVLTGIQDYGE